LPVAPELAAAAARQICGGDAESVRMHLESMRRVLDREGSGYGD